ncbi:hypothetical protein ACFSTH_14640 [Paenibacillus yanchengensis]
MRSYRYGPSTFVFIIGIILFYSVVPNPVMDSYAFTTMFLFIISAVLCYTFMDMETSSQESVTMLHSRSLLKLYFAKLLYIWLFTIPLALYAVLFPLLFHKFDRNPSVEELGFAFLAHAASSWLGVTLACWFSSKFIRSRVMSFLTLSVVIIITISVQGIENRLSESMKNVVVLLPPLNNTIKVLMSFDSAILFTKVVAIAASLLYGTILAVLFLFVLHKRKLDSLTS